VEAPADVWFDKVMLLLKSVEPAMLATESSLQRYLKRYSGMSLLGFPSNGFFFLLGK
jgi:hypothetical protein